MNRDPGIYVDHMLEAIANIELDTAGYDKDLEPLRLALSRIRSMIAAPSGRK